MINKTFEQAQNLGYERGMAYALLVLGNREKYNDNYSESFKLYNKSLSIFEDLNDQHGMFLSYQNLGLMFHLSNNHYLY